VAALFHSWRDFIMKLLSAVLLVTVAAGAPAARSITGTITDSMCATADHSHMQMGPTNAECTKACVEEHDASFVLFDGRDVYTLSDQQMPAKFAGRKVTVTGSVDARTHTIRVASIKSSNP
jgi:hypothetical protein